jgi:polyhydroxybutyrate depolymerase
MSGLFESPFWVSAPLWRDLRSIGTIALGALLAGACQEPHRSGRSAPPGAGEASGGTDVANGSADPSTSSESGTVAGPGTTASTETISVGGVGRGYVIVSPTETPAQKLPLVLVLHGDGGDGPSMRTAMPLDSLSGTSAYVAYPSGSNRGWDLYTPSAQNADDQFIMALVSSLAGRFPIDTSRVLATGFSSGAFMVNQLACRQPSLLRAIASQSGGSPSEPQDATASKWPNGYTKCASQALGDGPAALVVHGTADTTVTYDSGVFTAVYWAFINGCATSSSDQSPECVRYDNCPASRPVVFCSVPNMGHQVWTDATPTIWSFFQGF